MRAFIAERGNPEDVSSRQNVSRETSAHERRDAGTLFHVKRFCVKRFVKVNKTILLTYTKIPEDHIEQVFHIDPAQELAQ